MSIIKEEPRAGSFPTRKISTGCERCLCILMVKLLSKKIIIHRAKGANVQLYISV